MQRTTDPATGSQTIDGEQALSSFAELYDVAGAIRAQLIDLIGAIGPAPGSAD